MTVTTPNPHKPAEAIMIHSTEASGLASIGMVFNPHAPFTGCRICGTIYQSDLDRLCYAFREEYRLIENFNPVTQVSTFTGDEYAVSVLDASTAKRARWRKLHERRYHKKSEIEALASSGFAFTPEAAHKLAPYGITPLGNMHNEIEDALFTAPRAPHDDVES